MTKRLYSLALLPVVLFVELLLPTPALPSAPIDWSAIARSMFYEVGDLSWLYRELAPSLNSAAVSYTAAPQTADSLSPELDLWPKVSAPLSLSERVLTRLEELETQELDPWVRDDLRISWITVLNASRGNQQPHVDATYRVLGLHPDKIWPQIVARRSAALGEWCEEFWGEHSSPKKPVQSVKLDSVSKTGRAAA